MGNFFPMMVMGLFAVSPFPNPIKKKTLPIPSTTPSNLFQQVFWLSFGCLQLPTLQLGASYASTADPSGYGSPEFNATVALYLIVWGFALFTFFIFTCKINAVFAAIFLLVSTAAWVLSAAYWKVSQGEFEAAGKIQKAGGRCCSSLLCWDGICVLLLWLGR